MANLPSEYPWFLAFRHRYHPKLIAWTKEVPGVYKEQDENGGWITYIPVEMVPAFYEEAKKCKVNVIAVGGLEGSSGTGKSQSTIPDRL